MQPSTRAGHRRLPERELRQCPGADHRPLRGEQQPASGRSRIACGERHLEPSARLRCDPARRPREARPAFAPHATRPDCCGCRRISAGGCARVHRPFRTALVVVVSVPLSVVLLVLYLTVTRGNLLAPFAGRARRAVARRVDLPHRARRPRHRDRGDRRRERDPRALARRVRESGGRERVLHRGRDRRDRRQRGRARRRGRDRARGKDEARERDRTLVERTGRAARHARGDAARSSSRTRCRFRSAGKSSQRWAVQPCSSSAPCGTAARAVRRARCSSSHTPRLWSAFLFAGNR